MAGRCRGPDCSARGHWGFRPPRPAGVKAYPLKGDAPPAEAREPMRWYCAAHKDLGEAWLRARTGQDHVAAGSGAAPLAPAAGPRQERFL